MVTVLYRRPESKAYWDNRLEKNRITVEILRTQLWSSMHSLRCAVPGTSDALDTGVVLEEVYITRDGAPFATVRLTSCDATGPDPLLELRTLDEYLTELEAEELKGGQLFCEHEIGDKHVEFTSCAEFSALTTGGCFGYSTPAISAEITYQSLCYKLLEYGSAGEATKHFFNLQSQDWWRELPADVIPMPSGIYNDGAYERESITHKNLTTGKQLEEIDFAEAVGSVGAFRAIISTRVDDCGETHDNFKIKPVMLADFDGDGVAELVLEGTRAYYSDTCRLGTGSSMGAGFSVVVQKASIDDLQHRMSMAKVETGEK